MSGRRAMILSAAAASAASVKTSNPASSEKIVHVKAQELFVLNNEDRGLAGWCTGRHADSTRRGQFGFTRLADFANESRTLRLQPTGLTLSALSD